MTHLATAFSHFIGCDVGKAEIVIFDSRSGKTTILKNHKRPLAEFAASLDKACLVVCEATGGYEAGLLDVMLDAGIAAHRADARKVKAFIRSFGIRGKTDAIDAGALSQYGRERWQALTLWQKPEPARQRLQSLVLTRADLIKQRVAYKNRLAAPGAEHVRTPLQNLVICLNKQIALIEEQAKALIKDDPKLAHDASIIGGIEGIGSIIATGLLALMPELGHLNRRQAAALAGVAPHPNQSGARDGYRKTRGGRPEIKTILFMAALAASRSKKSLGHFYQTLVKNGKKKMVALVALMRKIIVIANAKLRQTNQTQLS